MNVIVGCSNKCPWCWRTEETYRYHFWLPAASTSLSAWATGVVSSWGPLKVLGILRTLESATQTLVQSTFGKVRSCHLCISWLVWHVQDGEEVGSGFMSVWQHVHLPLRPTHKFHEFLRQQGARVVQLEIHVKCQHPTALRDVVAETVIGREAVIDIHVGCLQLVVV